MVRWEVLEVQLAAAAAAAAARVQSVVGGGRGRGMAAALVDAAVLLEVIPAAESFGTDGARERPQSRVDSLVAGQLLVAGERLAARLLVAFERSLSYERIKKVNFIIIGSNQ